MQYLNQFIHTSLQKKSRQLRSYTHELYKVLPSSFTARCSVCNVNNHIIVLSVESSITANKLRYYQNDIAEHFSLYFNRPITQVSLKISPKVTDFKEKNVKSPSISPNAAEQIHSLAKTVGNHSLKQSLIKLANRTQISDKRK